MPDVVLQKIECRVGGGTGLSQNSVRFAVIKF